MRVRITEIHKDDAHHLYADEIVGLEGEFECSSPPYRVEGHYAGKFSLYKGTPAEYADGSNLYFSAIKYEEIGGDKDGQS